MAPPHGYLGGIVRNAVLLPAPWSSPPRRSQLLQVRPCIVIVLHRILCQLFPANQEVSLQQEVRTVHTVEPSVDRLGQFPGASGFQVRIPGRSRHQAAQAYGAIHQASQPDCPQFHQLSGHSLRRGSDKDDRKMVQG